MLTQFAGEDFFLERQFVEYLPVESTQQPGVERHRSPLGHPRTDLVARRDDVVHFLLQVFLGRRYLQFSLNRLQDLLFGESVALNGGRCRHSLGKIHLVQAFGGCRAEWHLGQVFAF